MRELLNVAKPAQQFSHVICKLLFSKSALDERKQHEDLKKNMTSTFSID